MGQDQAGPSRTRQDLRSLGVDRSRWRPTPNLQALISINQPNNAKVYTKMKISLNWGRGEWQGQGDIGWESEGRGVGGGGGGGGGRIAVTG